MVSGQNPCLLTIRTVVYDRVVLAIEWVARDVAKAQWMVKHVFTRTGETSAVGQQSASGSGPRVRQEVAAFSPGDSVQGIV